jgi:hypothetical protein
LNPRPQLAFLGHQFDLLLSYSISRLIPLAFT